ncbi:hypothetical protein B0T26DRAFT_346090 [Lasiosphaeria miniovina]|uniref:Uncharacterized protein n=1 Tax=Lasiosphaeria miniovina TaxID=1954250 RepID=A0AA40ABP5_9PEZI|nr:uncharacterized protein B0T26DRAFT_346090 [Lasiosphaeria miniovina]KAK0712839.1 hypothetical protein B0T26DRAFT_346090 [Lasiosphaeria miniovina]
MYTFIQTIPIFNSRAAQKTHRTRRPPGSALPNIQHLPTSRSAITKKRKGEKRMNVRHPKSRSKRGKGQKKASKQTRHNPFSRYFSFPYFLEKGRLLLITSLLAFLTIFPIRRTLVVSGSSVVGVMGVLGVFGVVGVVEGSLPPPPPPPPPLPPLKTPNALNEVSETSGTRGSGGGLLRPRPGVFHTPPPSSLDMLNRRLKMGIREGDGF